MCAEATHTFTAQETDWGFSNFIQHDEFYNPKSGWIAADGALTVKVHIDVQKDERWAYDSRKETGFVGLKNQGATCYMNSLLQYLFNIPYFRKASGSSSRSSSSSVVGGAHVVA